MKLIPINKQRTTNSIFNYLAFLNHQIEGRKQYIKQFTPNYTILNEPPVKYTQEQLFQKGILAPARLNGKTSLIIFSARLQYGEGLINNFSGYDSVWVYYGNPDNASSWKVGDPEFYEIPDEAVPEEVEVDTYLVGLSLETKTIGDVMLDYLLFSADSDIPANTSLNLNNKTLTSSELFLIKTYPKTTNLYFNTGVYDSTKVIDGQMQKLPPSYYIISKFSNEIGKKTTPLLSDSEYKNRTNYLFARTARGGSYYSWTFGYNPEADQQEGVCSFIEQATDLMGLRYLLDGDFRQKRFYSTVYSTWEKGLTHKGFQSFFINANDEMIFQIRTKGGSIWTGANMLNHEFSLVSETLSEIFIVDDYRKKETRSFKETAIPVYDISITGGENIQCDLTLSLW